MSTSNKVIRYQRHVAQYKSSMNRQLTNTTHYDELFHTAYRQLNTNWAHCVAVDLFAKYHQRHV